jgi:hypothetical protein
MYAQLYYLSEEGNSYPKTERLLIDDSLEGLLIIPEEHQGNNAYWEYSQYSEREISLYGGNSIVDFNSNI